MSNADLLKSDPAPLRKREVTIQDAAIFLNVSEPFLVKQLETGKLEYELVGTHRYVTSEALAALKKSMQRKSREALDALTELSEDMGLE